MLTRCRRCRRSPMASPHLANFAITDGGRAVPGYVDVVIKNYSKSLIRCVQR
jgi:hypothetical protein